MTVNRSNLGTTADGADIFLVKGTNSPFTNLGALSTSGIYAEPIRIDADNVTVTNKGSITTTGDGSTGIIAGTAPFGDAFGSVTVVNYGSIATSGNFYDANGSGEWDPDGSEPSSDGIDVFGDHSAIVNYGSITIDGWFPIGIWSVGADSSVVNYGTVTAHALGIVLDQTDGHEMHSSLVNYGQIHTLDDGSRAIAVFSTENIIKNFGSIQADGIFSFGISIEGNGNHGENYGTVLATGDNGRGVLLGGEELSFDNYGTIRTTGGDSVALRYSGENLAGTDGGTFANYGKVISAGWAVRGSFSDDHIVNRGSMTGIVTLSDGDDSYVAGKNSSLSGTLSLGSGDDLIIFEKGGGKLTVVDFVAGAGTDDRINVSGLGYQSFAEVMSFATQSGTDVVLKFGAKDQIVLQNVDLASLAADDFSFAPPSPQLGLAGSHITHGDYLLG